MKKSQDPRITEIIRKIRDFNSDTKQSVEKTINGLEEVGSEVDAFLDALREQLDE